MRPPRRGPTLVELLVVIAVIGLLVGLLFPAVQMARESARWTQCANNVGRYGKALQLHDHQYGKLPQPMDMWPSWSRLPGPKQTFYTTVLPFIDRAALVDAVSGGNQAAAVPIDMFTCPTRGGTATRSVRGEQACGKHPDWYGGGYTGWYSISSGPDTGSKRTFPGSSETPVPSLELVQMRDGTSQTLFSPCLIESVAFQTAAPLPTVAAHCAFPARPRLWPQVGPAPAREGE